LSPEHPVSKAQYAIHLISGIQKLTSLYHHHDYEYDEVVVASGNVCTVQANRCTPYTQSKVQDHHGIEKTATTEVEGEIISEGAQSLPFRNMCTTHKFEVLREREFLNLPHFVRLWAAKHLDKMVAQADRNVILASSFFGITASYLVLTVLMAFNSSCS
jgi:hypothetical protein